MAVGCCAESNGWDIPLFCSPTLVFTGAAFIVHNSSELNGREYGLLTELGHYDLGANDEGCLFGKQRRDWMGGNGGQMNGKAMEIEE